MTRWNADRAARVRRLLAWIGLVLGASAGPLAAHAASARAPASAPADQSALAVVVNGAAQKTLSFDWPAVQIGTGEYQEGPTGVTVFHFSRKMLAAVDVRGGGPGTVNTDFLRLSYPTPELDAVVFAGGSWYGLEATTAVATALKDDGSRDGDWTNIALSVGAIIYDFGARRLNEIYPDKRLAQAALRAARPGVFPLGAHGAGRMAMTGSLFGCNAHSGQGGAFRQMGSLKIAAFVVVNALGVVTTRDGRVAACYVDAGWPKDLETGRLMAEYPASRKPGWGMDADGDKRRNTTVSLIVTNQKLDPAQLQRLAIQVHSSMGRAIQPFSTEFDGDVLYAVSTAELDRPVDGSETPNIDVDVLADEVMWDAILASVPEQPPVPRDPGSGTPASREQMNSYAAEYVFSPAVKLRVTAEGGALFAQATGARDAYAIRRDARVELRPLSATDFYVPGRYPLTLHFAGRQLIINPGHWQQTGERRRSASAAMDAPRRAPAPR